MKSSSDRINELETQLAHLQRQYDQLNEVVFEHAKTLDRINIRLKKWESTVDRLKQQTEPTIDPMDEKPPHY